MILSILQYFSTIAISIVLEAVPFVVLGAVLSSVIEVYIPERVFSKFIPRNIILQFVAGVSMGFIIPSCECGIVLVVRRLIKKGMPVHMAICYMLAAPVVNPIVIASTYVAFKSSVLMVVLRVGVVLITALIVALICGRDREEIIKSLEVRGNHNCNDNCNNISGKKFFRFIDHVTEEFIEMGKFLIMGAMIAGAFRTFIPSAIIKYFTANIFIAIFFMILLAIILSVCSEADSFVASSFFNFPKASQLAFVTLGPMLDLKLIFMFIGVFKRKMILKLIFFPIILNYILCYLISIFIGK